MDTLQTFLFAHPLALLTLVIALGYALGEIRLPGNFRFGMAAILFVGLAFGFWNPAFGHAIPELIQTLGLAIFVYCVGLEAGPGFFRSLGKSGLRVNLMVVLCISSGAGLIWLCMRSQLASKELLTGLLCGLMNNTPALAAATDSIRRISSDPELPNQIVVGYGIAYPFSLIALLIFYHLLCRRAFGPSAIAPPSSSHTDVADTLKVEQLPADKDHWLAEEITQKTGLLLSRVFHTDTNAEVVHPTTRIHQGARLVVIGNAEQLADGARLLGRFSGGTFETRQKGFTVHRYVLSNPKLAGRSLGEIADHLEKMDGVLTRVRRGDVELSVNRNIRLLPGDRVRIVAKQGQEGDIKKYIGDSLHALGSQGSLTFVLGIFLGLVFGAIPLALPGLSNPLKLGAAGGPLVIALLFGYLGRTGPLIWNIPFSNNLALRHLGIALFFAVVGCRAGGGLSAVFNLQGMMLVATAVSIVLLFHFMLWLLLRLSGERNLGAFLGFSAGMQTQPAALTFASHRIPGDAVPISYATVFPLALVLKIIIAQLLVLG
ncbi:aspartate:alanine exchanger family transporter [Phragmitibacter flavus]|nr:TrkA C-terminal domain-containing protein [Phragmitibacter flavus]